MYFSLFYLLTDTNLLVDNSIVYECKDTHFSQYQRHYLQKYSVNEADASLAWQENPD